MRLFIGIDLPEEIRRGCQQICRKLTELDLQGRVASLRSLHLTVRFLGEVGAEAVPDIENALRDTGCAHTPFQARVGGIGAFPRTARPRVVWVGIQRVQRLLRLRQDLDQGLARLGFPSESREFSPHLTLLRLRSTRNAARLVRYLEGEGRRQQVGYLPVTRMHLFQSILHPRGAEHRCLLTAPLEGSPGRGLARADACRGM